MSTPAVNVNPLAIDTGKTSAAMDEDNTNLFLWSWKVSLVFYKKATSSFHRKSQKVKYKFLEVGYFQRQ